MESGAPCRPSVIICAIHAEPIDEAEQAIQRALALYPTHPRALQRLRFLKLQQGRPDEVAAPVTLSFRLDPLHVSR